MPSLTQRAGTTLTRSQPRVTQASAERARAQLWPPSSPFAAQATYYQLPPNAYPHDVAPAPDGTVWYSGQQGGFLPIFPTWNSYTSEMIGDHAVAVIYDAYAKGIRNFNVPEAYRLVRQNAFITPPHAEYIEGKGRRALTSYLRYGYIPLEDEVPDAFHQREQVSRTLEYAYDDYVAAQFASALGHKDDVALLRQRSHNWRNVFDLETRFVRGRHADGSWITPVDPAKPATFVTEANPWQYTFFVPHDIDGLIHAIDGRTAFIAKLDGFKSKN